MRRFVRRVHRKRPNYHWTATITNAQATVPGGITEFPLLVASDYGSNTQLSSSGCTMVRCVGQMSLYSGSGAVAGIYRWFAGVVTIDDDEPAFDISSLTNLVREPILATNLGGWTIEGATPVYNMIHEVWRWDITRKVRLKDNGISLMLKNSSASPGNITINMISRTLVKGDTN